MRLVHEQGALNWVGISNTLGTRSPKQCRERYHQNLKPTLNRGPITAEEGALVEKLVRQYGKKWAEIARHLDGRSDNAVKNWWNGSQNRRRRMERRKAYLDERSETHSQYAPMDMDVPQTRPAAQEMRPLPAPLVLSPNLHDHHYRFDTPLPSPPGVPSDPEPVPSLTPDCRSRYSPYSPVSYATPHESLELPSIKNSSDSSRLASPPSSQWPWELRLPPINTILPPFAPSPPELPRTFRREFPGPELPRQQHPGRRPSCLAPTTPHADYLLPRSHLPTAPNSPIVSPSFSWSPPPLDN